jgi:hypothetical protein
VVASALPPLRMASPRGTSAAGTRRMTVAADMDQNPPMTMPTSARPPRNTAALGAKATASPETSISTVRPSRRTRRSSRGVAGAMNRLVSTANRPETAIACPAWPSVRCRSVAMGVSRLTGMNSDATRVAAHRDMANTAPQPRVADAPASPVKAVGTAQA